MDQASRFVAAVAIAYGIASVATADEIQFAVSLDQARQTGNADKPVVITFSAPWCGWCRKMATTTFPAPAVQAIADQYLWVKLDPDDAPTLAARYRVNGLPHTVVLNAQDQLLGTQPGYMTPGGLVQFLEESLANPQPLDVVPEPLLTQLEHFEAAEDPHQTIRDAVERLSIEDRAQRDQIEVAIAQAGTAVYPYLATLLGDDRLATRAAAGGLLKRLTIEELAYDPFADRESREQQAAAWTGKYPLPPPRDLPRIE